MTTPTPVATSTPAVVIVPQPTTDDGSFGAGGTAFLIVLGIVVVFVGLMYAMRGSLRRMRGHAVDGRFGDENREWTPKQRPGSQDLLS